MPSLIPFFLLFLILFIFETFGCEFSLDLLIMRRENKEESNEASAKLLSGSEDVFDIPKYLRDIFQTKCHGL